MQLQSCRGCQAPAPSRAACRLPATSANAPCRARVWAARCSCTHPLFCKWKWTEYLVCRVDGLLNHGPITVPLFALALSKKNHLSEKNTRAKYLPARLIAAEACLLCLVGCAPTPSLSAPLPSRGLIYLRLHLVPEKICAAFVTSNFRT